ncbi:hypothetical protein VTK26DRAFT_2079 [Humicola hyalothermophila]
MPVAGSPEMDAAKSFRVPNWLEQASSPPSETLNLVWPPIDKRDKQRSARTTTALESESSAFEPINKGQDRVDISTPPSKFYGLTKVAHPTDTP